jgi:hypothetical protein
MTILGTGHVSVDLDEAARQLELAVHDAQVAYDSIGLGNLDWAHTNAITARAEAAAAEAILRAALDRVLDRDQGRD